MLTGPETWLAKGVGSEVNSRVQSSPSSSCPCTARVCLLPSRPSFQARHIPSVALWLGVWLTGLMPVSETAGFRWRTTSPPALKLRWLKLLILEYLSLQGRTWGPTPNSLIFPHSWDFTPHQRATVTSRWWLGLQGSSLPQTNFCSASAA